MSGLNLVLASNREFAGRSGDDYNAEFERATYVDGAQHLLRGLPRDLDTAEAAMLQRAMPPALTTSKDGAGGLRLKRPAKRNWVHAITFSYIWSLYTLLLWLGPKFVALVQRALQLEQEHHYVQRLLLAAVRLAWAFYDALCRAGCSKPGRAVMRAVNYMTRGVFGALREFAEKSGGPKLLLGWEWEWERLLALERERRRRARLAKAKKKKGQ